MVKTFQWFDMTVLSNGVNLEVQRQISNWIANYYHHGKFSCSDYVCVICAFIEYILMWTFLYVPTALSITI